MQFVNFTEIMSRNITSSKMEAEFALAALMEIPSQYKATLDLQLLGYHDNVLVLSSRVLELISFFYLPFLCSNKLPGIWVCLISCFSVIVEELRKGFVFRHQWMVMVRLQNAQNQALLIGVLDWKKASLLRHQRVLQKRERYVRIVDDLISHCSPFTSFLVDRKRGCRFNLKLVDKQTVGLCCFWLLTSYNLLRTKLGKKGIKSGQYAFFNKNEF